MTTARHFALAVAGAAAVIPAGLPPAASAQQAQVENFQLEFSYGDPTFAGISYPYTSPNLFELMQYAGYDVDQMLATAGYGVDWLLARTGETTDLILENGHITADMLLAASGHTTEKLFEITGKNADWVLAAQGKTIDWLLIRTGGTADQLMAWSGKGSDWLLGKTGKSADWILERSGYSISNMLSWGGMSSDLVADIVQEILCDNLDGRAEDACNASVDLVRDSVSELVGMADRSAAWWLGRMGRTTDWLLHRAGKSHDWVLREAGKTRTWLWDELGHDADWLLTKAGRTKSWLLTLTGKGADWMLDQTGHSPGWLFEHLGKSADWLLGIIHKDADWLLAQVGWRLVDGDLRFSLDLRLQIVSGSGIKLDYGGASQLVYVPGTPSTPVYDRRVVVLGGAFKAAHGLGATGLGVNVTYTDPTGITYTHSGDAGILNQDFAVTIDDARRFGRPTRHSDEWLATVCIPLKLIIAALAVEVPPASAAALELVPDVMMQVEGDVGYRLRAERTLPQVGVIDYVTLPQPQSVYEFLVRYRGELTVDARLTSGSWGFAWGLPCAFGAGVNLGYDIPGGQELMTSGPAMFDMQSAVQFPLGVPPDYPRTPPTPPGRLPRPGTPATPAPTPMPSPVTPPQREPRSTPPGTQPIGDPPEDDAIKPTDDREP